MTDKRAKELADLEPPRSVRRISGFLRDLTLGGAPRLEPFAMAGGPMLGLASRPAFLPGGGFLEAFARLTAHYAVQAADLEAFAQWLVLWTDKYREMEVVEDPTVYDEPAFPAATKPSALPLVAAPETDAPPRRTRRRDDPPRENSPRPVAQAASPEEKNSAEPSSGRANHRPVRRPAPEAAEAAEPKRRIDLAALVRRGQPVTFGAGMMVAGATLAAPTRGLVDLPLLSRPALAASVGDAPTTSFIPAQTPVAPGFLSRGIAAPGSLSAPPPAPAMPLPARHAPHLPPTLSDGSPPVSGATSPWPAARPFIGGGKPLPDGSPAASEDAFAKTATPPELDFVAKPPAPDVPTADRVARPGFPTAATILGAAALVGGAAYEFIGRLRPHAPEPKTTIPVAHTNPKPYATEQEAQAGKSRTTSLASEARAAEVRPRQSDALRSRAWTDVPTEDVPDASSEGGVSAREPRPPRFAANGRDRSFPRPFRTVIGLGAATIPTLAGATPGFVSRALGKAEDNATLPSDPRLGQITLVAPPVSVASPTGEQAGSAVRFEWAQLVANAGDLDDDGLAKLAAVLPPGAQAIYPALPPGTAGAANLRLAPNLLGRILERGYGPAAAGQARAIASATPGTTRPAAPVAASLVPVGRPVGASAEAGILGRSAGAGQGDLAQAGEAQAKRGGSLGFLGLPIRLAPALGGRPELKQQQTVQAAGADAAAGRPVRPEAFAPLRQRLFPGLQSVSVEPDQAAWRKAAPSFGLRGADPTTVLASDAAEKPPSASGPTPSATQGRPPTFAQRLLQAAAPEFAPASPSVGSTPRSPRTAFAHAAVASAPGARPVPALPSLGTPIALGAPSLGSAPRIGFQVPTTPSVGAATLPAPFASTSRPQARAHGQTDPGASAIPAPFATTAPKSRFQHEANPGSTFHPGASQPAEPRPTRDSADAPDDGTPTIAPRPRRVPPTTPYRPNRAPSYDGGNASFGDRGETPHPGMARGLSFRSPPAPPTISPARWAGAIPERLYAAAPPRPAARALAIQRSTGGGSALPTLDKGMEKFPKIKPDKSKKDETPEIGSLATEVWSILKRRLANEAERRGRW